jgi:hypothetical protein
MMKTVRAAAAIVALCFALTASYGYCHELTDMALSKRPIKVFLGEFSNDSGQAQIAPDAFRNEVEKALKDRRSVSFVIVKSVPESDVQVSAAIKGYQYLEKDPVKPSLGMIMAIDAVTSENYAELSAEFTVVNTATGGVALKEDITGFVKRMMTPAESVPLVYDKLARKFVADSFGKGE